MSVAVIVGVCAAPLVVGGYIQLRLNRYSHWPRNRSLPYGTRGYSPEHFAPEGRVWLRRFRIWQALIIPYWLAVYLLRRVML
jgi:hypothetical protein